MFITHLFENFVDSITPIQYLPHKHFQLATREESALCQDGKLHQDIKGIRLTLASSRMPLTRGEPCQYTNGLRITVKVKTTIVN